MMNSKERKDYILKRLIESNEPQKGHLLANDIGVTRQVIVKDIAILRAEGKNIIATPEGYIIPRNQTQRVRKVIAVCHTSDRIDEELEVIVRYGGTIIDVIVEHPVYGEMKGMLMIKSMNDLNNFMEKFNNDKVEPLSKLTGGVHIHTIEADSEEIMTGIINELKKREFIACD